MSQPLYPRKRDPVPIVQEAGWAPGPVLTDAENLAPTGIRSPDRPARTESLYRLSYRGPPINLQNTEICLGLFWTGFHSSDTMQYSEPLL